MILALVVVGLYAAVVTERYFALVRELNRLRGDLWAEKMHADWLEKMLKFRGKRTG